MGAFQGKVAVHAITWGQNYLQGFEEAAKLGYKAIESWPSFVEQYENRENELLEILAKYGLTRPAFMEALRVALAYGSRIRPSGRKSSIIT
jgi:sugar phosphate isomerase/epimerase